MNNTVKDRLIAKAEKDGFLSVEDIEAVFSEVIETPVAWRYRAYEWGVGYWHYFTNEPRFKEPGELWEPLYSAPNAEKGSASVFRGALERIVEAGFVAPKDAPEAHDEAVKIARAALAGSDGSGWLGGLPALPEPSAPLKGS